MQIIAGVDEAGRGPLAGPVVAACVIFRDNIIPHGLRDSKKLSKQTRERIYEQIIANCYYSFSVIDCKIIDEINILSATMLAMREAITSVTPSPDLVLIDGNRCPQIDIQCRAVVGGDDIHPVISAASIVAKVERDKIMARLHESYPQYGWDQNSGYGTRKHLEALAKHGITKHHRLSFAPVRNHMDSKIDD